MFLKILFDDTSGGLFFTAQLTMASIVLFDCICVRPRIFQILLSCPRKITRAMKKQRRMN